MKTATEFARVWSHATTRQEDLSPASRGIIDAVQAFGASLVGELSDEERLLLVQFACALIEGPIRNGLAAWHSEARLEHLYGPRLAAGIIQTVEELGPYGFVPSRRPGAEPAS